MPAPQGMITHFFLRASTTANANTFTDVGKCEYVYWCRDKNGTNR